MRVECIQAVQTAIGRQISAAEAAGIEDKIRQTMRRLASRDPQAWAAMPQGARLRRAAEAAAIDFERAAALREERAALQVEAHARHVPEVERAGRGGFEVIRRKMDQADALIKGVQRDYMRRLMGTIDYATRNDTGSLVTRGMRWASNLETPERSLAFIREVFGVDTGDAAAKAAAKAWLESVEGMRKRFNDAGGDIRKLMYGYLPQPHSSGRVREAGIVQWVNDVLPMIDRSRYVTEAGRPMTNAEVGEMLEQAWRTIQSDGWADIEPGSYRGEGSLASAGSQARVIHFKSPEDYVRYLAKYGQGSVFEALHSHVGWMARNIALVETFGPNPNATFRTMWETAKQAGGADRVAMLWNTTDAWRELTGALDNPESQRAARIGQALRNIQVIGKLQRTLVSSVTDIPAYFLSLGYHRLNFWQGAVNLVRATGPEMRQFADLAGLVTDSIIADMHLYAAGRLGETWDGRLASATMKVQFQTQWQNTVRRAFSVSLMGGMARLAGTPWDRLHALDRAHLERKGWTPDEWAVVQAVELETWRNTPMLTPAAILRAQGVDPGLRERVVSRLLGTIADEAEYTALGSDLRTRTATGGGLQRGTGKGELWRTVMLFKSYPIAMLTRHWDRALNGDMTPAGRVAYSSALLFGMTLFGGLAIQLLALLDGKDPPDVTSGKFWASAFSRGGGAGFFGDMLLMGTGRQGQSGASAATGAIAGPAVGSAFELLYDVGIQNVMEASRGEDTHFGAEAFRWLRGHTPFVNLWFGKTALDQAVLNQAQEALSPGHTDRLRARAERDWNTSYWWEPQDTGIFGDEGMVGPQRAPEVSTVLGER